MASEITAANKQTQAVSAADLPALEAPPRSLWQDAWHRLSRNRAAMAGLFVFLFVALLSLIGPFLTPYSEEEQERTLGATAPMESIAAFTEVRENGRDRSGMVALSNLERDLVREGEVEDGAAAVEQLRAEGELVVGSTTYTMTGRKHLFGTDNLGRDLLTRLMYGGRVSLSVGFLATLVAILIGVLYGATAGFLGGKVDAVLMRIVDILYALPFTIFVILLMVVFGRSLLLLFVVIGLVEWLTMSRIVRGQVIHLKTQQFVEVAHTYGAGSFRIIRRHLVPNVLGPVIVYATLLVPAIIMFESFLSFLGLGVQPPNASWGTLIKEGADNMTVYPWMLIYPAIFFSVTLLSLNFLGDGLRDALDPKGSR